MNPEELFKRFFGFTKFPDGGYKGYGHEHDSENWSSEDNLHSDVFGEFEIEMNRQMEEVDRHMREMFRVFRIAEVPSLFPFPEGSHTHQHETNPRNFMLKEDDTNHSPFSLSEPVLPRSPASPSRPSPPTMPTPPPAKNLPTLPETDSLFEKIFTIPRWNRIRPQDKLDSDLDTKSPSSSEIADLLKGQEQRELSPLKPQQPHNFFRTNSYSFSTIVGPDGKVEERRIVRDSSGREEETITRKIGDSSHSVTTITGEGGVVEKQETFQNIEKDKLSEFDRNWGEHWRNRSGLMLEPKQPSLDDSKSIFEKLFGLSWK
ncbi:uncharacterized protein LOC112553847 isoform X1 [Pomacea canaliculata]|uniref:uncharacterized protein LOC112553847 isoform X1 n=1 Tax=Pomacea canaliculata TaxID=400727 RepID=UPI000D727C01|nr:uncharacterized protein LOC112553847 isoform X1 [Pomacea canaliculata]